MALLRVKKASLSAGCRHIYKPIMPSKNSVPVPKRPATLPRPCKGLRVFISGGALILATCRWARRNGVAACEAIRALGNLSRSARAAQVLVLEGAIELLPPFSSHEEASVRFAAAGLLVNVCGAGCNTSEGAMAAVRAITAAAEMADASTAALLARALWNAHAHAPLRPECAREAAEALAMFIDDDSLFSTCEASRKSDSLNKLSVKLPADQGDQNLEALNQINAPSIDNGAHFHTSSDEDADRTAYSGEDLGFEEGEVDECDCEPCGRLAAWEELVGVAIPLLEKLRPPKADASVGTD